LCSASPEKHVVEQLGRQRRIEVLEQVADRLERADGQADLLRLFDDVLGRVDGVEDEAVDGALAEVAGDLGAGVVGAKGFLVDVLLDDVAQDVRVDFVSCPPGLSLRFQEKEPKSVNNS
jgi:hypothetical protein